MEAVKCSVCHNDSNITLIEGRLNLYKCGVCTHIFTWGSNEKEVYNDDYFLETHKNWFNNPNYRLFDFIHKKILELAGNRQIELLDVGCGKGDFLRFIAAKESRAKLAGLDLVNNEHPDIRFIKADLFKTKFNEKFNVICSLAVIEHMDNPHLFIQRVNDILSPGGILFIMSNNSGSLIYRIASALNKLGFHTAFDRLYSIHHLNHFTNYSLRKIVEMHGLDVLMQKNHNFPLKAIDIPQGHILRKKTYKFFTAVIFLFSNFFNSEILQTIVCRKKITDKDEP